MKYGFIGLGNMASAIIGGLRAAEQTARDECFGYDIDTAKCKANQQKLGITPLPDIQKTVEAADIVVLAVKPQMLDTVMADITPAACAGKLLVSIAAGKPLSYYEEKLPGIPVVRVMPNINATVRAAATAVCGGRHATPQHICEVRRMFDTVGHTFEVPETLFSAFAAISGSSVAFAYLYIDAIARAGIRYGFSRAQAQEISAMAALGSARLILESDTTPQEWIDRVCSPGGTTIEGLFTLQEDGFEAALHRAIDAVVQKDKKLKEDTHA